MAVADRLWLSWRRTRALRGNRCAVSELLCARHDDPLAGSDAFEQRIIVADDRADLDRALLRDELAVRAVRDKREKLSIDPQHGRDRHDEPVRGLPDDARADVLGGAERGVRVPQN